MSKKQTAVEWLVNELKKSIHYQRVINEVNQSSTQIKDVIEQAKQMEREQHGNTWDAAIKAHDDRGHVYVRSSCDFDDYEVS
jgi:hypothetical protein